jgi:hypothetical protein
MRFSTLAVLCGCLFATPYVHATDASVEKRLNERGIKFETDDDGDYRVVYSYKDEGRTQLVYVGGSTETTGAFVVREVFAPAANVDDDRIDAVKLRELMVGNWRSRLGGWAIDGKTLLYVIKLPDDVSATSLEAAMDMAAAAADDMETRLTGGKDTY